MNESGGHVGAAFALGFALGAAPGPVQLLILSETAKRGFSGGMRVILAIVTGLSLGFSSLAPSEGLLRGLRVTGGAFLVWLAIAELRSLRVDVAEPAAPVLGRTLGPTARGVTAVVLNPGAWIFFATTASAVVAGVAADGGTSGPCWPRWR